MLSAHMQTNSIMWKENFIDNKTNSLIDYLCDCLLLKTRHSFRSAIDSSALLVISLSCSSSRPDTIAICFLTSSSISNFSSDFETVVLKKEEDGITQQHVLRWNYFRAILGRICGHTERRFLELRDGSSRCLRRPFCLLFVFQHIFNICYKKVFNAERTKTFPA